MHMQVQDFITYKKIIENRILEQKYQTHIKFEKIRTSFKTLFCLQDKIYSIERDIHMYKKVYEQLQYKIAHKRAIITKYIKIAFRIRRSITNSTHLDILKLSFPSRASDCISRTDECKTVFYYISILLTYLCNIYDITLPYIMIIKKGYLYLINQIHNDDDDKSSLVLKSNNDLEEYCQIVRILFKNIIYV